MASFFVYFVLFFLSCCGVVCVCVCVWLIKFCQTSFNIFVFLIGDVNSINSSNFGDFTFIDSDSVRRIVLERYVTVDFINDFGFFVLQNNIFGSGHVYFKRVGYALANSFVVVGFADDDVSVSPNAFVFIVDSEFDGVFVQEVVEIAVHFWVLLCLWGFALSSSYIRVLMLACAQISISIFFVSQQKIDSLKICIME